MTITPIAHFRSAFPTKFGVPRQSGIIDELRGRIVFEPTYRNTDAFRGLEGFNHRAKLTDDKIHSNYKREKKSKEKVEP